MSPRMAAEERYLNRELSWIAFDERVLALAEDPTLPLLERVKFLAIAASNLDEFFQVRVAGLKRQQAAGGVRTRSVDGLTPAEQLSRIGPRAQELAAAQARLYGELAPLLADEGIRILRWTELDDGQQRVLQAMFSTRIFPVLTPLAVDPGHPFPYISNLSLNLAIRVEDPDTKIVHFARVKIPPLLGRFVTPEPDIFVPLEDVIAANLGRLFPGMRVVARHLFRVTRNADLEVDDDGAEDLLEALEEEIRRRRVRPAVRLEVEEGMPADVRDLIARELQVGPEDIYALPGLLNLAGMADLQALDRPDLQAPPFQGATPARLLTSEGVEPDIFDTLRAGDMLVQHPYDSFGMTVQRLIEQASTDPHVLAIKQTLYRTSGQSPIVEALVEAAEAGKQVVVLVEIKARFDEVANIAWARTLENAGCHVVYGMLGLKTHAKLCLVVREEDGEIRRYVHVGTGNYNPATARVYEDIGLLTADPDVGAEVSSLFNYLTGYARHPEYTHLLVAPQMLRARMIELIRREADLSTPENPGYIAMKVNNLVDEGVIDALYNASGRGVTVDLVVRAIATLRPGVPGMSESIRVRSVLGRFLEHSRVFLFGNGGEPEVYIGSADMMHRNLDRRVEVLVRVDDPPSRQHCIDILRLALSDNAAAWRLQSDGSWRPFTREPGTQIMSMQGELMTRAHPGA
ncbi:MAG TPA: RNA degradosome polyphosphate kinase [Candidatus Limnocylindria bacterium]